MDIKERAQEIRNKLMWEKLKKHSEKIKKLKAENNYCVDRDDWIENEWEEHFYCDDHCPFYREIPKPKKKKGVGNVRKAL